MKDPEQSWSERRHYLREDDYEPRHYGNDPLRLDNTPNQQYDDSDYRPEGLTVWLVASVLVLVFALGCIAYWSPEWMA